MSASSVMRFLTSRQPVTVQAMLAVGFAGLFIGVVFGYLMMGSMHAVRA